jgi:predicted transcriptional regulator
VAWTGTPEVAGSDEEDKMDLPQLIETISQVSPNDTFAAVSGLMFERKTKIAAVIQDRKVLGFVAESEITRRGAVPGLETSALRASDVMITSVEEMLASTPVIDAARAMRSRRIQYLALVDDGGDFVGIVTLRRVLFEVMDELDLKVDNLERELMADGPGG